jgi:hypothetical protein
MVQSGNKTHRGKGSNKQWGDQRGENDGLETQTAFGKIGGPASYLKTKSTK